MSVQTAANQATPKRRTLGIIRKLGIFTILLAVLISVTPRIATRLRDTVMISILESPSVADASGASFGWILPISIFAILVALLIVAVPRIVAHTGLRDRAINAILASPSVAGSSDSASFGWF